MEDDVASASALCMAFLDNAEAEVEAEDVPRRKRAKVGAKEVAPTPQTIDTSQGIEPVVINSIEPTQKQVSETSGADAPVTRRRGKPKASKIKNCNICRCASNELDPCWSHQHKDREGSNENDEEIPVVLRWGYPPKDGIPEGNSCWYCSTTVRLL